MNVSILICTYGHDAWRDAAWGIAYRSAFDQNARQVNVIHQPDGTLARARNEAALRATSDYLCFLDADDELAPGYLDAIEQAHHDAPGWALYAPAVQYVHPDGATDPAIPNAGRWPDMNECVIGTVLRRDLFNEVGGFRELPSLEDYDLWLRCVKAGATIVHVPDAIYRATARPGSRNSDQSVYFDLRREHASVWRARPTRPR